MIVDSRAAAGEPVAIEIKSVVLRPLVEAEVPARHLGVLARISVDEGAVVDANAVLASLDDRTADLKVKQAELEQRQAAVKAANRLSIEYTEKALEVAKAELKRSQESNERRESGVGWSTRRRYEPSMRMN